MKTFLLIITLLGFVTYSVFAQEKALQTLEEAKKQIEHLYSDLATVNTAVNAKIDREVSTQVSEGPKGEFETTKQFELRLQRARLVRSKVVAKYEGERNRQRRELKDKILHLYQMEFTGLADVHLEEYDADKQMFKLTVKASNETQYDEILPVPLADAPRFKEMFKSAVIDPVYGVSYRDEKAQEYYFGLRATVNGKTYTTIPPEIKVSDKELLSYYALYKDQYIVYLRKSLDKYLHNRSLLNELERNALDGVDADYFDSRFIVMDMGPAMFGGKMVSVIFLDRPDAVVTFWIYRTIELRTATLDARSDREMRFIRTLYGAFLRDRAHSI